MPLPQVSLGSRTLPCSRTRRVLLSHRGITSGGFPFGDAESRHGPKLGPGPRPWRQSNASLCATTGKSFQILEPGA